MGCVSAPSPECSIIYETEGGGETYGDRDFAKHGDAFAYVGEGDVLWR